MLTVEICDVEKGINNLAEVEIFCDRDGLELLMRQLNFLDKGSTHIHLMTPSWAGDELNEGPRGEGTKVVQHLRITMVPQDALDRVKDRKL